MGRFSRDHSVQCNAAFEARDWAALRGLYAADAVVEDRRRVVGMPIDAERVVADFSSLARADDARYEGRLVASFGDRVALERVAVSGGPAGGRFELEFLQLLEVDEAGQIVFNVTFDADDRRAAQREALARLIAGDPVAVASLAPLCVLLEGHSDNDPTRMRAVLTDDLVLEDHRRSGVGRIDGVDAFLAGLAASLGLVRGIQIDILSFRAIERHGAVGTGRSFGTLSDGGDFEGLWVAAFAVAGGRITRIEFFELDQLDAALARFAELRPDPLRIPPNAATRASDRWSEAVASGDWESVEALFAPTLVFEDRERRSLVRGDRELLLANDRLIGASRPRTSRTVLATAGDRLALQRILIRGTYEDVEFEREYLRVIEIDAEGRLVAVIAFDPDDRRAASREMLERWARSDAAYGLPVRARRAILDRDLDRLRAELPDGYVFHDRRRTGAGRIEGADDYIAWNAALLEGSSDAISEVLYYVAVERHGFLAVSHEFGTLAEGGAFESAYVVVAGPGRTELFELEHLELARARFEELRPDPTRIPPNAASRARDRTHEAWLARDWDTPRAMASDDFVFEDRGKRALLKGGVELWLQSNQFVRTEPGARLSRELIGTAGDRVALERIVWSGGPAGSPVEREHLRLTEVGAEGSLRASIRFDLDDRSAAFAEAEARFVAGEGVAVGGQAPVQALNLAIRCRDWEALRACLADDLVVEDHRTLGLSTLRRDEWIESLRALTDLAPDWCAEAVQILAWNRHGRVIAGRLSGTVPDGGGPFGDLQVNVFVTGADRIQHFELFDIAEADRALARFAELCAGCE